MRSEFKSMTEMCATLSEFAPKLIARSSHGTISDAHFLLCEFREMIDEIPNPHRCDVLLPTLHQKSVRSTGNLASK
jgi:protein-ribulosamine 3-kinase